ANTAHRGIGDEKSSQGLLRTSELGHQLVQPRLDLLLGLFLQPVRVHHALQVVVLVLEDARLPADVLLLLALALEVLVLDLDPLGPLHGAAHPGEAQAALDLLLLALAALHDLRIHQHGLEKPLLLVALRVEHHQAHVLGDLRGREAHPLRRVHELEHVLGQRLQLIVELGDLLIFGSQGWVGVSDNSEPGHLPRIHLFIHSLAHLEYGSLPHHTSCMWKAKPRKK
ncbi:unnamed protein product, partial [Heterosigma akashiwo]